MSYPQPWLVTYEKLGRQWANLPEVPAYTLSDYIRQHAEKYADRSALVFVGETISYAELDNWAQRFADVLLSQGFRAGDVLAVQMPNTPQYVIALIAAARIGVVVTSISPLLAPPEIIYQCKDANVSGLLAFDLLYVAHADALRDKLPAVKKIWLSSATEFCSEQLRKAPSLPRVMASGVDLFAFRESLEQQAPLNESVNVGFDDVLYLQYTGGTTGAPKGAQLTSRNIFTNSWQADVFYGYRQAQETVASGFPLFHIGGAALLFTALRAAATFILVADPRNIEQFCADMKKFPPTIIANVPALYQMLVNSEAFRALDFSNLSTAVSGAAPFSVDEIKRLESVIGTGKFCEVYGMTETAPVQTLNPAEAFKPGFVGIPLPGTDLRIVDPDDKNRELPIGEPGEVVVAGPQVMKGYLNLPEATQDVIEERYGKRWMHTGDIGYLDDEGYLKICDRSKDMLIVGGYKVFSVEIENKLQALEFVEMSAVVGREDEERPGNDIVQVYIQRSNAGHGNSDLSEAEQRQAVIDFCRENMAPYKVPKEVLFVDAIPLTSVGKIDKKALRG